MVAAQLDSAIYEGWVRHRRYTPWPHSFRYQVFMMYLRLDELERFLALSPWCSSGPLAVARFKRSDYFGDPGCDLDDCVRREVQQQLQREVSGPIYMLTNLRYFGYIVNPLTVYYCFDCNNGLAALLLEVTNTPWGERHHYVLTCDPGQRKLRTSFDKQLHVSPFNPMDMTYFWNSTTPDQHLAIHMKNVTRGTTSPPVFDATLCLKKVPLCRQTLHRALLRYPWMTAKVVAAIYWEALKLFIKGTPFYGKPGGNPSKSRPKQTETNTEHIG